MNTPSIDYSQVGLRLQQARQEAGLTQQALAERTELSPSCIAHIERGNKHGSIDALVRMCLALHLSADFVLFGDRSHSHELAIVYSYLEQQLDVLRDMMLTEQPPVEQSSVEFYFEGMEPECVE